MAHLRREEGGRACGGARVIAADPRRVEERGDAKVWGGGGGGGGGGGWGVGGSGGRGEEKRAGM